MTNLTNAQLSSKLEAMRAHSEASWEGAVDTASDEDQAQHDMDAALSSWDDAISHAENGDLALAIDSLRSASRLESEWGDDSDSRKAIKLIESTADARR